MRFGLLGSTIPLAMFFTASASPPAPWERELPGWPGWRGGILDFPSHNALPAELQPVEKLVNSTGFLYCGDACSTKIFWYF